MSDLRHSVVIATCGRLQLLKRALHSVSAQSLKPDRVVVIVDQHGLELDQVRYLGDRLNLSLEVLVNRRMPGASGAWNTALDHLIRSEADASRHIVSILDDDDWWESDYLRLVHQAARTGVEVIAAAIKRYDAKSPEGRLYLPPQKLSLDDFLVGNPGIQGSNLSVRLSTMLWAGLFDEALSSCTDRDICIRLADLQPKYTAIIDAVVHHDTLHGRARLSDKGSSAKLGGLESFYCKWHRRMTSTQREAFRKRASDLFGWSLSEVSLPAPTDQAEPPSSPDRVDPISLVVGVIVDGSKPERCRPLIAGLQRLSQHHLIHSLDIVLLENGEQTGFDSLVAYGRNLGLNVWPAGLDQQAEAVSGLPIKEADITRHKPIAVARTLLQRFVFEVSHYRNNAPAWILDDDFRLPEDLNELIMAMIACRDGGIDVALGGNSGAAPVPASSLLRTQLVDTVHFLQCATVSTPTELVPDPDTANAFWLTGHSDYHYDLTRNATDRLETPFIPAVKASTYREAVSKLLRKAERLLAGEAISRPVLPAPACAPSSAPNSCLRGGNTLVLDPTLLRDIPNMAPRVKGRPTRRSDMIWAATALYSFGKTVKAIRLPMAHDRSMERADEDDTQRLVDDIIGYSFFRSYEETLRQRAGISGTTFTEEERSYINRMTSKYATERLAAYRLSFWRVAGLTRVLANLVDSKPWWLETAQPNDVSALVRFIDLLKVVSDPVHLKRVEQGVDDALEQGQFMEFLTDLERIHPECVSPSLPFFRTWVESGREMQARKLLTRYLSRTNGVLLGMGEEGVVIRFDDRVFKVFDRWTSAQRSKAAPTVKALIRKPARGALPQVLTCYDWPEAFVAEYMFEESEPYTGGHGPRLVEMLQTMCRSGWVHSNISPKNLRLTKSGLQLIDIGKSLEIASPLGQEMMIRRAFLSWRFAYRDDLVTLMRASLKSEWLPELTGWRALQEAVLSTPSKERLDQHIRNRVEALSPRTVLDYGCGKPRDAVSWAEAYNFTAFDIDPSLPERWLRDAPNIPFWTHSLLEQAMATENTFDLTICSLVLCAVDDDTMATILSNVRRLSGKTGRVLMAVCDPSALHVTYAADQTRHHTNKLNANISGCYHKTIRGSTTTRVEYHRSIEAYRRAFARAGLRILNETAINGFDIAHLERVPEFLVFELAPLTELTPKTSLLIKLCALEADTALYQVRHLESQLSRPRAFDEVVLLLDPNVGPFPRAHCAGDLSKLRTVANQLMAEGVADRVIEGVSDGPDAAAYAHQWTGHHAHHAHCANGQPATSILMAIEKCRGDYILHADADVLISRPDPGHDHIADAIRVFEDHPDAVTLALSVHGDVDSSIRTHGPNNRPYRTEAMTGWISKARLAALCPLPGAATAGRLDLPWHRMLDIAIANGHAQSLRRGSQSLWFAAPDNARKANVDDHLLLLDRVEAGYAPPLQEKQPLIQGPLTEWMGPKRSESMVLVICGRNVRPGAIDRCLISLREQTYQEWGAVVIDDASDDGSQEVLVRACQRLGDRVTLLRRRRRVGLLANTFLAIRHLITSPETIVVLLDLDDALANRDALTIINQHHESGADMTVGSMLRTDKQTIYPANFSDPRHNRGGNVWQHLRTFRKRLFDRIELEDLKLDGHWIDLANDWAFMLPIAEMAENPVWIRDVLYLHEPSTQRPPEEKAAREAVVGRIVAKPSYRSRVQVPPRVTVLCYHRVLEQVPGDCVEMMFHQRNMAVSADTLKSQLRSALRQFEPIRVTDFLAAQQGLCSLPENALLVTVDDGYRDFQTTALPIMSQMGIEPVLFARVPMADGYPSWAPLDLLYVGRALMGMDIPLPSTEWRERLLRQPLPQQVSEVRKQLKNVSEEALAEMRRRLYLSQDEMASMAGVAIGAHGLGHVRWTNLTQSELEEELGSCLSWLRTMGGHPIAAYPDGQLDEPVATQVASAGYRAAFTLHTTADTVPANFSVRRIVMPDDPAYINELIRSRKESAA